MNRNMNNMEYEDELLLSTDEDEPEEADVSANANIYYNRRDSFSHFLHSIWKKIYPNKWYLNDFIQNEDADTDYACHITKAAKTTGTNTNASKNLCQSPETYISQIKYFANQIPLFLLMTLLKLLRFIKHVVVFIYFLIILVANMPFTILKNLILFLKCYTNSPCIHLIPLNLIPSIIMHLWSYVHQSVLCSSKPKRQRQCSSQCFNDNNSREAIDVNSNINAASKSRAGDNGYNSKMILLGVFAFMVILIATYSFFDHNNSKGTAVYVKAIQMKSFMGKHLHVVYLFPGEKCMRAGRCCKGILEGTFRWLACFTTLPIRTILFLWPKRPYDTISKFEGIHGIRNYIDKIFGELKELKEEIDYQSEILLRIENNLINLVQKVQESANSINILKPKVQKSKELIEGLSKDVDFAMNSLKHIITIRNDVDKLQDSVKMEADDSYTFAMASMHRSQSAFEGEQHRILSQIESLELFLKDNQAKVSDKNYRVLQRIISELDKIKIAQNDIKKRIVPLMDLSLRYKELSDSLQKDVKNKLIDEMIHHEQMSKRTEKVCTSQIEKLEHEHLNAKSKLNCFINKTIQKEANTLNDKLRTDISKALYERTVEIARILTEQALSKQPQLSNKSKRKIKKCGLLAHVFNLEKPNGECKFDEVLNGNGQKMIGLNVFDEKKVKSKVDTIMEESLRLLASDDIGVADYALESSGGSIITDRSSPTYSERAAFLSLFGFTFGKIVKSIRKVIQPGSLPGECWAFKNDKGHVVIRLARSILITHITIDHVSSFLTPDGKILSAPKDFNIYALSSYEDYTGVKIGAFQYSKQGDPVQTFYLNESSPLTQYIQVNFLSNHGNEEYTCIYRIRVHGNYTE